VKMSKVKIAVLVLFILVFLALPIVFADKGGFSISSSSERVSETGQKTIIAWNGTNEMLILSTDVRSSSESEVVEIMPLPSNPTISKGEKQSFLKVTELVNTYLAVMSPPKRIWSFSHELGGSTKQSTPKITIMFQEAIGVHYLTVVKAEEAGDLIWWLENFLEEEGYNTELSSNLEELFSYYIQNKMNFFVIDMIETNSTVKTVDPLTYEFESSKLYYPLRISTLFSGDTYISLFTITNNELNGDSIIREGFDKKAQFQIKQEALAEIHANMTKLFSSNPYICYFRFNGALESFDSDISAGFQPNMPMIIVATLSLGSGLTVLLLIFPMNKIGLRLKNIDLPINRRLEMASLLTGLVGVSFTVGGFFLPWGLVGFGKDGEVLIALNGSYETSLLVGEHVIIFLIDLYLLALIPYVYLLLAKRNSKVAIGLVTAGAAYIMLQTIMWMRNVFPVPNVFYVYHPIHSINIGVYTTLIGSSFIILSGLLSFWRLGNLSKQ